MILVENSDRSLTIKGFVLGQALNHFSSELVGRQVFRRTQRRRRQRRRLQRRRRSRVGDAGDAGVDHRQHHLPADEEVLHLHQEQHQNSEGC